jgi:hypothetical protein
MATTIKLKNSVTTTNTPSSLAQGEVAINITDKKVWVGNAATTPIQLLGAGGSASFGALTCTSLTNSGLTSGRVTYAGTGGLLQDDADFTFNGTTVTMANDASISGLTVGKGGGAVSTNTAIGASALAANTTGSQNTAVGFGAADAITTGTFSVAFGADALGAAQTSTQNSGLGWKALEATTTGESNTAVGSQAMRINTTGSQNTALGREALYSNTTASNNTAVGYQSLYSVTTGYNQVALGYQAGYGKTTVGDNYGAVYIGYQAGYSVATAIDNVFVGGFAGKFTTASNNTGVGSGALYLNTTGTSNTALGYVSMVNNTTGSYNTAIGQHTLQANTTASSNTAVGYQAGYSNATSSGNVFLGTAAGYTANTTGNTWNTFVGAFTGYSVTTGKGNTFIGTSGSTGSVGCGYYMTTGSDNVIVGGYTGNLNSYDMRTLSNRVVISDGLGNRQLTMYDGGTVALGNSAVPQAGTGITFPATQSASSDANTLDDYEEGTWTPTVGGNATYAAGSFGRYTKIGNIVTCQFYIEIATLGTGSTNTLSGFPFQSANLGAGTAQSGAIGYYANLAVSTIFLTHYIQNNATTVRFVGKSSSGTTADDSIALFGNGTVVYGFTTYRTA